MLCPVILDSSCPKSMDFIKAVEAKVTAEITINTAKSLWLGLEALSNYSSAVASVFWFS
jgi:hypothetical protein